MPIVLRSVAAACGCLLLAVPAYATDAPPAVSAPGACTLSIHVTGFRNTKGLLGAELFTSSAGWPEDVDRAYRHASFPIHGTESTAVFDHLPPGRYSIVVLHDENENEKLDRNLLQVPKEGFGFANNPHVLLIAPALEKAAVAVTCPVTRTDITLIYK